MTFNVEFAFDGGLADEHAIDFYDGAQALVGFQRSLALTTHLVLNGEVITRAPALKNAVILNYPPDEGSWKTTAVVLTTLLGGTYALGTAPKDTPLGHLVSSAYDYVVTQSLGFHVDYDKSLGQSLEEFRIAHPQAPQGRLRETQFDSVIEKCEVAVREMHRPIAFSGTATSGRLCVDHGHGLEPLGPELNKQTFEYLAATSQSELPEQFEGWVSSYNINTFKGRIYVNRFGRPIPFTLSEEMRTPRKVALIATSLTSNARESFGEDGVRYFSAFRNESTSGRLKSFYITDLATGL